MTYHGSEFDLRRITILDQVPFCWICQGPTKKGKHQEQIDTWMYKILGYISEFTF